MRTDKFFASTGVRLSFIYSGLLLAAFSLAIALTWLAARSAAESDLRDRISLEIEALKAEIRDEGIEAAIAAIAARAERPGALEYWLVSPAGDLLSGDLLMMTTPIGWHHVKLPESAAGAEGREEILVLTATMPDGSRLSVGDDLRSAESVRDAVLRSLLWIGIATVGLGIAAGAIATRGTLAQIDSLTKVTLEVVAGRLDARLPLRSGAKPNDLDQLGDSINRMLDHIDTLVRSLRRVSRDVAHDLRTPLSHVQQRLERARTARSTDECLAAIESAENKVSEVLQAFDAILRLSEIEAGAAKSKQGEILVADLVERLIDAYEPDVEASGRSLHAGRVDKSRIRGDGELLAQAIANLIENAVRHTPTGSRITIDAVAHSRSLSLSVTDNGPGIPPDRYGDVIQPFTRLDTSRSTAGFGLGLSIVSAIARTHEAVLELGDASPGLRVTLIFERYEPTAG